MIRLEEKTPFYIIKKPQSFPDGVEVDIIKLTGQAQLPWSTCLEVCEGDETHEAIVVEAKSDPVRAWTVARKVSTILEQKEFVHVDYMLSVTHWDNEVITESIGNYQPRSTGILVNVNNVTVPRQEKYYYDTRNQKYYIEL